MLKLAGDQARMNLDGPSETNNVSLSEERVLSQEETIHLRTRNTEVDGSLVCSSLVGRQIAASPSSLALKFHMNNRRIATIPTEHMLKLVP